MRILLRMPKWLDAIAQRDGVGEKSEQLMTKKSTSLGLMPVCSKSFSMQPQMTVLASARVASIVSLA